MKKPIGYIIKFNDNTLEVLSKEAVKKAAKDFSDYKPRIFEVTFVTVEELNKKK